MRTNLDGVPQFCFTSTETIIIMRTIRDGGELAQDGHLDFHSLTQFLGSGSVTNLYFLVVFVLPPDLAPSELEEGAALEEDLVVEPQGALPLALRVVAGRHRPPHPQPVGLEDGQDEAEEVEDDDGAVGPEVRGVGDGQAGGGVDVQPALGQRVQQAHHRPVHVGQRALAWWTKGYNRSQCFQPDSGPSPGGQRVIIVLSAFSRTAGPRLVDKGL